MSGWDTPSRPTWDPQDGPEDSTQAFPASDGSGADDRWSWAAGSDSGWGRAADGQDAGRADLGRLDRREPAFPPEANGFPPGQDDFPPDRNGFPADRNGFPPDQNGFPPDRNGFPPDRNGFPPDQNGFPPEANGFPPDGASSPPPSGFFTQQFEQRQPGATLAGRGLPGPGRYVTGPQASARDEPPWPGPARQESARQESARPEYGRGVENGRTGEYGRPDLGRADLDRPGGQDFPRRDPGRADFTAYSTYSGQPDQAEQAPPPGNRGDGELAARMDPALQDFFAPTKPDPRYSSAGRPSEVAQPLGLPGPGRPGLRQSGPQRADPGQEPPRGGNGRGPRRPGRAAGAWEDPAGYPTGPHPVQRRPGSPGGGRDEDDSPLGGRRNLIIAIAAVLVIVVVVGGYLVLKPSGNNNTNASGGSTPTTSASTPASSPAATPKSSAVKSPNVTGSGSSAGAYLLSTPSTAAGYPIGADPHFLATATTTVATIEQSGVAGGGGTVTGSPVSASYTLPDEQTIEFVGYQGTFDPTKVMANLASYGSSEATYPAGPNGGELACANTTATASTPSGAVCVWVTKSTLGFTEFFTQANGPEALNSAQAKGAEDTVNLRASVETLKS
jgi:hypothetical protein